MKKPISFFLLFFISSLSYSQTNFSIFGGAQATSAHYTNIEGIEQPTEYKQGIMGGIALKIPFENRLMFHPTLYYSQKGYKVTLNNPSYPPDSTATNNNTNIHTIEFAPLLHLALSKSASHAFIRFGPALDFNVKGTETFDKRDGSTVTRDMPFSFWDYGLVTASGNVHLGLQLKAGFQIFAHYAHGLGSLNNADEGPRIKHRIAGLSLGWTFGQNKNNMDDFLRKINR